MKKITYFFLFCLLLFAGKHINAQDNVKERLNLPGDNLNLFAVMNLFQESETLESFEKNLNSMDSKINNLDLNGDDQIDYIKVLDYAEGSDHTIILQVAVNENENQDVAVFTVQKDNNNQVKIQLIGDEELYGKDYIIEPNYGDNASSGETPNPGYKGNVKSVNGNKLPADRFVRVEVSAWPLISYLFMPNYVVWRSPWYWGYYPPYWSAWRPYYWDYYYGYHSHRIPFYYRHYRHCNYYSYPHWSDHYYNGYRSHSNIVYKHRESGHYNRTYSRPDLRTVGSTDYRKNNSTNERRTIDRSRLNENVIRNSNERGNRSPEPRIGDRNNDRNTDRNVNRDINRSETKRSKSEPRVKSREENRSNERPTTEKRYERIKENKPSVRSESRPSAPRRESPSRSSSPRSSGRSSESNSGRR